MLEPTVEKALSVELVLKGEVDDGEVSSLGQIRAVAYSVDLIRFKDPSANCIDLVSLGNSGL